LPGDPKEYRQHAERCAELARLAKVHASTVSRMEAAGAETVSAHPKNIEAVLTVLERRGVVIEEDGIRLRGKRR
jgi:hypothetical protein